MITKTLASMACAVAALGTLLWVGYAPPAPQTPANPTDHQPIEPSHLPYRGIAIQLASGYRPIETYGPLLAEIAELGANTVLLSVAGYMEHAQSQSIYIEARRAPAPADLQTLIGQARELDLKVILMPIVLLNNPRGSEWRGVIDPPDWETWWREYTEFVLYFADIARESAADGLIIGSELVSTEKHIDKWRQLIAQARQRFWGGRLGYSANWDHYRPVEFWDQLDFIGMTSYYTLADQDNPSVAQIVQRWGPIRAEILAWQRTIGKPLLLTEVGWCSQVGAARAPWNYYHNQKASPDGLEEQRRLYEAFVRVWRDTPELLGVIWWEWKPDAAGPADYGYTPKGKPAERILRQWLQAADPTATSSAPARQRNED